MKAILVSVDYADLLSITLPYNRHHFSEVHVVTTPGSDDGRVAREHGAEVFETDLFTADGATFNKWRALEAGLDAMGREGWLCIMDADVLWPKIINWWEGDGGRMEGDLYTPLRRMWENWPNDPPHHVCQWSAVYPGPLLPLEQCWVDFPLHRQQREFAGYSQIFHASDPVLGPPPWHGIDWRHAGGADSFFQEKWPEARKVRPPFEVLHLGPAGQNWFGRASALSTGEVPPDAAEKAAATAQIWRGRAERRRAGLDPFTPERLSPPS